MRHHFLKLNLVTLFEALTMHKPTQQFTNKLLAVKSSVSLAFKKTEDVAKFMQLELAAMEIGVKLQEQLEDLQQWEKQKDCSAFLNIATKIRTLLTTILAMKDQEAQMVRTVPPEELAKDEQDQDPCVSIFRLDAAGKFVSGLKLDMFHDFVGHASVGLRKPLEELTVACTELCKGYLPGDEKDWHESSEKVSSVKDLLKLANKTIVHCDGSALKDKCEKISKDWVMVTQLMVTQLDLC